MFWLMNSQFRALKKALKTLLALKKVSTPIAPHHFENEEMTMERDPHGKNQHTLGAKMDVGKIRAWLVLGSFGNALLEVGEVGTYGAEKYTPKGWIDVPDGEQRYMDAAFRHLMKMETEETDVESGLTHLAHAVWGLLAVMELKERKGKVKNLKVRNRQNETDRIIKELI